MSEAVIRRSALVGDDLVHAQGLSAALNWPYRLEDWSFAHSLGEGLALWHGDRLIGTGMRWIYGPKFATIGMIIVDAEFRGQGLGARIVDGLIEGVGDRSVILNATPDGLELYRRRGFESYDVTCQHQGIAEPVSALDPKIRIDQAADADWPVLTELDCRASGMPRGRLLEALADVAEANVLRGNDGSARGYAVCREFGRGHVIGPVVAHTADEAKGLIAQALSGLAGQFVRVNTSAKSGLGQWLEEQGLRKVDTEEAMVRGTLPQSSSSARIFALCSNSLG